MGLWTRPKPGQVDGPGPTARFPIKANGLIHPIVLDDEGALIDGRNRLAACRMAGVEPTYTRLEEQDPFRMRDQPVPDRGAIFGEVYDDPPELPGGDDEDDGDDEEPDLYTGAYVRRLLAYIKTLEDAILRGNVPRRLAPGMIDQLQELAGLEKSTAYRVRDDGELE